MIKIISSGCSGYMGRVLTDAAACDTDIEIIAGVDIINKQTTGYPVYGSFKGLSAVRTAGNCGGDNPCVVIDFSSPSILTELLEFGIANKTPLVLCTTGYSSNQINAIEEASKNIAVFRSGNMSLGINLLADLIRRACKVLGDDFDVEIVERHHSRKLDAPSGTALMLADAARDTLHFDAEYIYERANKRKARDKKEIGISSVRGGTIVGIHEVIFAGHDEVIELRHTAASREVFAKGALRAAKFLAAMPPGLYSMDCVLKDT